MKNNVNKNKLQHELELINGFILLCFLCFHWKSAQKRFRSQFLWYGFSQFVCVELELPPPWLLIRFFSAFVLLGISFEVFEWNEMEKTFLNFTINPWIPLTKVQHMPLFLFEISKHTFVCTEIFKWNSFLWNSDRFTSCAHTQITHIIKNIRYIIVFSSNVL